MFPCGKSVNVRTRSIYKKTKSEKMKRISKHKTKLAAIALVLLMASVLLTLYTPVNAQIIENPGVSGPLPVGAEINWTHTGVQPRLSFTPNPIGVGQVLLVNFWVTPPPSNHRS
jgi:hypothetical protein